MARRAKQKMLVAVGAKFDPDFIEKLSKRYALTKVLTDRLEALEAHRRRARSTHRRDSRRNRQHSQSRSLASPRAKSFRSADSSVIPDTSDRDPNERDGPDLSDPFIRWAIESGQAWK